MVFTDLIAKKRDGLELQTEEIEFMIKNYTNGTIPDYQMSAMMMAILLKGMSDREIFDLTMSMTHSGDNLDLSAIEGIKADKHSTGGVGDKTSLVLCPMVAACGLKVAKMSGRGLGHTGGTIDKLESFPGFSTSMTDEEFIQNVNDIGMAIAGQTANLAPADKKMYALRDVTATVPSIPLIVSSIMSKKLASGSDVIVLDVKCGDGSFMKTIEDAEKLAGELVRIGNDAGRKCAAIITDMDQPLGYAVGNALEVKEAISVLNGEMKGDLLDLCLTIGSKMLMLSGIVDNEAEAARELIFAIENKLALEKFADFVERQGGKREFVYNPDLLPKADYVLEVKSIKSGYVKKIKTEQIGLISMHLGGGRITKEDVIDLSVGVVLNKKIADKVEYGELIGTIHAKCKEDAERAAGELLDCYEISEEKVERSAFIKKIL